ncbi:hypothetical protein ACXYMU_16300 [Pontibacter sp. CAU 1760]
MKTLFSHNIVVLVLSVLASGVFVSCEKHEMDDIQKPLDPQAYLASLKDSVAYTLDGKHYTCDTRYIFGRGNLGANRDNTTGYYQADTVMHYTEYGFAKKQKDNSNNGNVSIYFIRKYAKNQMTPSATVPAMLQPKNIADHYKLGQYRYASDFLHDNRQNGVKISVSRVNGYSSEDLSTLPAVPAPNSQDNSTFAITRFEAVGDGSYLLEAKFTANVFDANQTPTRVENGYMRFRVY